MKKLVSNCINLLIYCLLLIACHRDEKHSNSNQQNLIKQMHAKACIAKQIANICNSIDANQDQIVSLTIQAINKCYTKDNANEISNALETLCVAESQ